MLQMLTDRSPKPLSAHSLGFLYAERTAEHGLWWGSSSSNSAEYKYFPPFGRKTSSLLFEVFDSNTWHWKPQVQTSPMTMLEINNSWWGPSLSAWNWEQDRKVTLAFHKKKRCKANFWHRLRSTSSVFPTHIFVAKRLKGIIDRFFERVLHRVSHRQ